VKELSLGKDRPVAIVDDEDFNRLNTYRWHIHSAGYAVRNHRGADGVRTSRLLHHEVLRVNTEVDHKNGNKLDNRKENLRVCTHSKNGANCKITQRNTSGFKGVSFEKSTGRWKAYLSTKTLGRFDTAEEAARAYDRVALLAYEEFAILNFPTDSL
jgi:hypothetical protein